jgi:diguanylate cyclase (GGDEF)-like protein
MIMKKIVSLYLIFAVILAQFFAAYFVSKGRNNYRKAFSAVVLCVSVYLFGFLMIINCSNLEESLFWNQIQYLGLPFLSVLWLLVAIYYTKLNLSFKLRLEYLFIIPALTFLIRLTNPWHHLFYTRWEIRQVLGYYALYLERGIWYYVNIFYTILCLIFTVIIYAIGYLKNKLGYTKSHFLIFLFASVLPLIGLVLVLFVFEEVSIDYSALIMPVALLTIGYGILRFDFLEIRTLAREAIFEKNLAGMVVLGPGKRVIDYNKAAEKFFESINISLDTYPIEQILVHNSKLAEIFESETNRDFSLMIDGEERFFEIDVLPLGDSHDKNTEMLKSIRDVTEERKIQEQLIYLATTDSLSGLYNRAEFMRLAHKEFETAKKNNEEMSLLIMDLDHFKAVNDTFGHAVGDAIIQEMGSIIKTSFRKTDIPGRIGGEEFAIVLKNASSAEAEVVAEQVREIIESKRVIYGKHEIRFTVSIGVAALRHGGESIGDIEEMFKKADDSLYKAKVKGRNCVVTWQGENADISPLTNVHEA